MNERNAPDAPPGWGKDDLTWFFDLFRGNVYGSFHNLPREYHCLRLVDEGYLGICGTLKDDRDWMRSLFIHKAHSIFRAGAHLAMGGQFSEVFVMLRACLESALCAHYLHVHEDEQPLWLARHESEENRKKVRRKFQSGRLKEELRRADEPIFDRVNALYEMCIDLGGHPNEKWLTSTLRRRNGMDVVVAGEIAGKVVGADGDDQGGEGWYTQYLTNDDALLVFALTNCARVGLAALLVFRHLFPGRWAALRGRDDLLGLEQFLLAEGYEREWNFS
jgi:hypothetical protein